LEHLHLQRPIILKIKEIIVLFKTKIFINNALIFLEKKKILWTAFGIKFSMNLMERLIDTLDTSFAIENSTNIRDIGLQLKISLHKVRKLLLIKYMFIKFIKSDTITKLQGVLLKFLMCRFLMLLNLKKRLLELVHLILIRF